MALAAQLLFEDAERFYNILKCDFDFELDTGKDNFPNEKPSKGYIETTLLSPCDEKTDLHNWFIKTDTERNGGLFFEIMVGGKKQPRIVVFQKAKCVLLEEKFETQKDEQMTIKVKFSAQHVHFGENADFFLRFVTEDEQKELKNTVGGKKEILEKKIKELKLKAIELGGQF